VDQEVHTANGKAGDNALSRVPEVLIKGTPHLETLFEPIGLKIKQFKVQEKYFNRNSATDISS